jgi:hypothetical protein
MKGRPEHMSENHWIEDLKKWVVIIAFILGFLSVLYLLRHG